MTCVHGPAPAVQLPANGTTLTPPLDVNVALIGPDFPFVESSQPANSNVLVELGANVMPVVGTTGGIVLLPTVAPGVPKPMTICPAALLIPAIPTLPGFDPVGPIAPGVTKSPVPLMSRIPAAVTGCVWLLVMGAPKPTVSTTTPGFAAAVFVFVQEMRTLPPPGISATPLTPEAPTSV
jgi:hypothetical protein